MWKSIQYHPISFWKLKRYVKQSNKPTVRDRVFSMQRHEYRSAHWPEWNGRAETDHSSDRGQLLSCRGHPVAPWTRRQCPSVRFQPWRSAPAHWRTRTKCTPGSATGSQWSGKASNGIIYNSFVARFFQENCNESSLSLSSQHLQTRTRFECVCMRKFQNCLHHNDINTFFMALNVLMPLDCNSLCACLPSCAHTPRWISLQACSVVHHPSRYSHNHLQTKTPPLNDTFNHNQIKTH